MADDDIFVPKVNLVKWNTVMIWKMNLSDETCPICKFTLGEKCIQCQESANQTECPPIFGSCCEHSCYHKHCLDKWFAEPSHKDICPLCKQHFTPKRE